MQTMTMTPPETSTIEDALTCLWLKNPARRDEIRDLCIRHDLTLDSDEPEEDG